MRFTLRLPFLSRDARTATVEERFLVAINAARAIEALPPYSWHERAARAAQDRAFDLVARDYFGHQTPDGALGFVDALRENGVTNWALAGENLAQNNYDMTVAVERAMVTLMNSPTHRENILDPVFDSVGIGYATRPTNVHVFVNLFLAGVGP